MPAPLPSHHATQSRPSISATDGHEELAVLFETPPARRCQAPAEVDVFIVEMNVPIVSWFVDLVFTYEVSTQDSGRAVVVWAYSGPGAYSPWITWPLQWL